MDKKTIVWVVILAIVLIFYFPIMEFLGLYEPPKPVLQEARETADTTAQEPAPQQPITVDSVVPQLAAPVTAGTDTAGIVAEVLIPDTIVINTNKYIVTMSSVGGGPVPPAVPGTAALG